jgi:inner membrane protein involved in colicin E2 resistance
MSSRRHHGFIRRDDVVHSGCHRVRNLSPHPQFSGRFMPSPQDRKIDKYGLLFVSLTFVAFFLFEILNRHDRDA